MIKLAILMDPLENIDPAHDSSFAMLLAAQAKGWSLYYFQQQHLYCEAGQVKARAQKITVFDNKKPHFHCEAAQTYLLHEFDIVLMRKDPPFDMPYIYTTYLLEQAEKQGVLIVNKPQSLRDANEKLFTLWFANWCPKTLISADKQLIKAFWQAEGEIVLKPLDGMAGRSIFYAKKDELNINVMIETVTQYGKAPIMAQRYIPAIKTEGDKRILMLNGQAVPYALARLPAPDDFRGNMAAGATTQVMPLNTQEQKLCQEIGPHLREKGLLFVGLDVIGGYLTEINVTSPTGIQELNKQANLSIAHDFMGVLEHLCKN